MAHYTADGMLVQAPNVNTYDHIYLSPHLDDAVLSCGGRIWKQAQAGQQVLVVTLFAGPPAPDAPLSPFARELHTRWGHQVDAVTRRQEEDRAALALLGAQAVHWPYTDCIYRRAPDGRFLYASEEALWGKVHSTEDDLVAELSARLATLPLSKHGQVYMPLAVGHHVDHQITRYAVEAWGRASIGYEDFPYAQDTQAVRTALAAGDQRRAELVPLPEQALKAKIGAIACYRSQISSLWSNETDMVAAVHGFAEQTGGGRLAERYWVSGTGCSIPDA